MPQILRAVSEGGLEISITRYGIEIARMVPSPRRKTPLETAGVWMRIDRVAAEVAKHPSHGMSAVAAVREERE